MTTQITISIYLNTWKNYNINGAGGGFWVDLPCDIDEELERLAESTGEEVDEMEVFINNFETSLDSYYIDEDSDIYKLNETAEEIAGLDDYELEKLNAIIEYNGGTLEDCLDYLDDYEFIEGETLEDYAYQLVEDMDLPEVALRYFDYETFARDLSFDIYHETENGLLIG